MGAWALLLSLLMATARAQVCSVNDTIFEVAENTNRPGPLADISVPAGQQVTLGPSSTPDAFRIQGTQLFLNVTPDYEENTMLEAHLECRSGDTVVTQLRVFVFVLDVNDNSPEFPFQVKVENVSEDTKVNTIVIPATGLEAQDRDQDDILFYTLQEVTPGTGSFFSLVGTNLPALRLDRRLDFDAQQRYDFLLLVRDTREENAEPSHTATATLILEVQPADLRPPWFLPCAYSDHHVCINAEYHGAVPTGHQLPGPLVLRPGPIYAVDGDQGINQHILYSIVRGQEDGTFAIGADSGNLTMTRSVPSPKTFTLVVKGEQADRARYSVTWVKIEARNATGSPPYFTKSRYHGMVARGSGGGVEVKDATAPSLPLRVWAQDPDFPDLNSAIAYRVTNNTDFRMDGETLLTASLLAHEGVFYAEVEANNTVSAGTARTVVEIQVLEWEEPSPPTGPPETPTSPETGRTSRPPSGATSEAPRPPGPSQGPSATSSATPGPSQGPSATSSATPGPSQGPSATSSATPGPSQGPSATSSATPGPSQGPSAISSATPGPSQGPSATSSATPGPSQGPHPSSSTIPRPPASSTPGGPPSVETSTFLPSASPSGGSTQTLKPGTSQPMPPGPSRTPQTSGPAQTGGGSTAGTPGDGEPGVGAAGDRRFSVVDMAALGGVLGTLLLLALLALLILVHKHYGQRLKCCSGKAVERQPLSFDNEAFDAPQEANWAPAPRSSPGLMRAAPEPAETPEPALLEPPSTTTLRPASESPELTRDGGSPAAVRSILTKERRPEGGYKAVWFGEDIGAEADVVVLNTPASDAAGAIDSGSEASSDEDAGAGPHADDTPSTGSSYI
ncbi:LOW QUALITY PROTEIN: cadherin-related family member 5 [Lutra lutra]|uniref:LOW QUALITY PROTEIN: cadherin-related family member 5 n=1 Tax=Lutra lutra TaxID=9657 RepID=UPI001FD09B51|nr:LOW QUALITY PROTEIN: cadherin-related family member 5 [Lutra lutra]